ncbi:hypothetical protein Hdeb2414_s0009g00313141 [Helianthus debilis subsp. tardiflorus]
MKIPREGPKVAEYVQRLHDLSQVVPYLVELELKMMEPFIWGLAPQILRLMTVSVPPTAIDAVELSVALSKEAVRLGNLSNLDEKKETRVESSGKNKRKLTDFQEDTRTNDENKAKKEKEYIRILPKCDNYLLHHAESCRYGRSNVCNKVGHIEETCQIGTRHRREGQDGSGNHRENSNNDYKDGNSNKLEQGQGCGSIGHFQRVYLGTKPRCDKCKFHHEG